MEQASEAGNALNAATTLEPGRSQLEDRRFELDPVMRALVVVMGHELPQHVIQVALSRGRSGRGRAFPRAAAGFFMSARAGLNTPRAALPVARGELVR